MWTNGKTAQNGYQSHGEPVTAPELPVEHVGQEHGVSFKQYSRGNNTWYAHKDGDKWCLEKVPTERLASICQPPDPDMATKP